ncbi:hypothetical protein DMUE_1527 [Dictyocoela muelleri]|nr:hypothetical protein DMUE_1527 [Dictyocoela muelleri]
MNERTKSLESIKSNTSEEDTKSNIEPEILDIKEYCTWCCASYDEIDFIEELTTEYHDKMKKVGINLRERYKTPGCTRCAVLQGTTINEYLDEYFEDNCDRKSYFVQNSNQVNNNLKDEEDKKIFTCENKINLPKVEINENQNEEDYYNDEKGEKEIFIDDKDDQGNCKEAKYKDEQEINNHEELENETSIHIVGNLIADYKKKEVLNEIDDFDERNNSTNLKENDHETKNKSSEIEIFVTARNLGNKKQSEQNGGKNENNNNDNSNLNLNNTDSYLSLNDDKSKPNLKNTDSHPNLNNEDLCNRNLNRIISLYKIPKSFSYLPRDDTYISRIITIYNQNENINNHKEDINQKKDINNQKEDINDQKEDINKKEDINQNEFKGEFETDSKLLKNTSLEEIRIYNFKRNRKPEKNNEIQNNDFNDNNIHIEDHDKLDIQLNEIIHKKHEDVDIKIIDPVELRLVGSVPNISTENSSFLKENKNQIHLFPFENGHLIFKEEEPEKNNLDNSECYGNLRKIYPGKVHSDTVCLENFGFKILDKDKNDVQTNRNFIKNVAVKDEIGDKKVSKPRIIKSSLRANITENPELRETKNDELIKNVIVNERLKENQKNYKDFEQDFKNFKEDHKDDFKVVQTFLPNNQADSSIIKYDFPSKNLYSRNFFENISTLNKPKIKINKFKVNSNEKIVKTGKFINYSKLKGKDLRFEIIEEAEKRLNRKDTFHNKIVIDKKPVVFIDESYKFSDLKGVLIGQLKKKGRNGVFKENWFCMKDAKLTCFNGKENKLTQNLENRNLITGHNNDNERLENRFNHLYQALNVNLANNIINSHLNENITDNDDILICPTNPSCYLTQKYTLNLKDCRIYLVKNRYNFFCREIDNELFDITDFNIKNVIHEGKNYEIFLKNNNVEMNFKIPILEFALSSHGVYYYYRPKDITSFLKWMISIYHRMGKINIPIR